MLSSAVNIFLGLYSAFNQGFCPTCYEYKHRAHDRGPIVDPWKTLPTYVWIERALIVSLTPSTNLALHVSQEFLLAEVGNKHEQPPSVWSWGEASTSAGAEFEDLTTFSSLARRCLAGSFICIFRKRPISWKQIEIPWDVCSYLLWKHTDFGYENLVTRVVSTLLSVPMHAARPDLWVEKLPHAWHLCMSPQSTTRKGHAAQKAFFF